MIVTAKILQGEGKKLVVLPDKDISRYLAQKRPSWVEIRLNDGRTISADQRKNPAAAHVGLLWAKRPGMVQPFGYRHDHSQKLHQLSD